MRKSLIAFGALLLCALVLLSAAVQAVNTGRTDIAVAEQTLSGDPSAADGLVLETFLNLDRQLFWHSVCKAGDEPEITTDFSFTHSKYVQGNGESEPQLYFSAGNAGFGISGVIEEGGDLAQEFMMEPVFDLARDMEPGEKRTEVVQLNQYYDKLQVFLDGSGGTLFNDEIREAQEEFLTDYFRIPIPDEVRWEITVEKDQLGNIVNVSCNEYYPEDQPDYEFTTTYGDCVFVGDALYLLPRGNTDLSNIRGGYGVYRIPVGVLTTQEGVETSPHFYVEELENVYPLDPADSDRVSLCQGPEEGTLLLFRETEEQTLVQLLDAGTMTILQELTLNGSGLPEVWYHGDLLILVTNNYVPDQAVLRVYTKENGEYGLWTETALHPMNDDNRYYHQKLAFDGRRLAIVSSFESYRSASCRVTVYGQSGLLYAGDYQYTCDTLADENRLESYNWVAPLQIHWEP